jgi:hypothetical protein
MVNRTHTHTHFTHTNNTHIVPPHACPVVVVHPLSVCGTLAHRIPTLTYPAMTRT